MSEFQRKIGRLPLMKRRIKLIGGDCKQGILSNLFKYIDLIVAERKTPLQQRNACQLSF